MSETETDEMARVRRTLTFVREQRDTAWDELKRQDDDLAAARAEAAGLREAVERIERVAKGSATEAHTRMWPVVERDWLDVLAIIERIPAPVEPSGEAESGEGALPVLACVEPGCFTRFAGTGTPQEARQRAGRDGWTFHDGDFCPEHSPAPVPSGGQVDGEGEALLAAIVNGPKNGEECPLCCGDSDSQCLYHRGYDDAFPLAARPVLSRDDGDR